MKSRINLAAALLCAFAASGSETPLATSLAVTFDLDTNCGETLILPRLPVRALTYSAGETISAMAPDNSTSWILENAAATAGTINWTPATVGSWTLTNSGSGTAVLRIQTLIYGMGTTDDPVQIGSNSGLTDFISTWSLPIGTIFEINSPATFEDLAIPSGYAIARLSGGLFRLDPLNGELLYTTAASAFDIDSEGDGPNRTTARGTSFPVAYSGDNWLGGDASSSLTITPPFGAATTFGSLAGTGARNILFDKVGTWTVALAPASGTPLSAVINVPGQVTSLSFR